MVSAATAAAVADVVDLERLLWVPGAKTIFVPVAAPVTTPSHWTPFIEDDWVSREEARLYLTRLKGLKQHDIIVTRRYGVPDQETGDPVVARLPQRIVKNAELGISIRLVKQWKVEHAWEYRHG